MATLYPLLLLIIDKLQGSKVTRSHPVFSDMATSRVLVYGGKGALGSSCIAFFKKHQWWVASVDLAENDKADANVVVKGGCEWSEQSKNVVSEVEKILEGHQVDAVLCVAGGWSGGNAAAKEFIENCESNWKQSVWTSSIAAELAAKFLKTEGLLVLPGAKAALEGTPGMIGYGLAKAAVHHLTKSLAQPKSGLPENATVVALLPVTLDTPMNRKWMPKADFSSWTSLDFIAELLHKWSTGTDRPKSGSLVQLVTENDKTDLTVA